MATVLCAEAATTFPVPRPLGGGLVAAQKAVYTIAAALSKDDLISFFYLPPCSVISGFMMTSDVDTGTETLEIDIGDATAGDTDKFLDSGVLTGDLVTDVMAAHAALGNPNYRWFNGLIAGPLVLTVETLVQGKIVAAAHGGGTGTVYVCAFYQCD